MGNLYLFDAVVEFLLARTGVFLDDESEVCCDAASYAMACLQSWTAARLQHLGAAARPRVMAHDHRSEGSSLARLPVQERFGNQLRQSAEFEHLQNKR